MTSITVKPLREDLPFGARLSGVDAAALRDDAVRAQINAVFEERGLLLFEGMESSGDLQRELCSVFGPLQGHAMKSVPSPENEPGLTVLECHPSEADTFEVDGKVLSGWVPWHYDACYTKALYRGAVLRALVIPPEGGLTGFACGVQLHDAISPELRARFAELDILYHPQLMFMNQRFGLPKSFRVIELQPTTLHVIEQAGGAPRAIHPAIWRRKSGERVLHVSPWQAAGIHGHEDPEGDALLEALCQEIYAKMQPYWHSWKPTDMMVWDNWRFIHTVSGHKPEYGRRVHRAAFQGDYGLGRFESEVAVERPFETMG
jgi:taurine dioxygenase